MNLVQNFEIFQNPISLGYYVFLIIYYFFIFSLVIKILLEQKDPAKTIGYVLVLIFIPVFGLLVYQLFGQNLRKEKILNRKAISENKKMIQFTSQNNIEFNRNYNELKEYLKHGEKLAKLLKNNDKAFLSKHNKVELLVNGETAFPAMLESIKKAKHFIHLEFYRISNDYTGNSFFDALEEKANEGVKVRLIYDDVGSIDINKKLKTNLRNRGIECWPFMPVKFPSFTSRINFRDHRKILIIDGEIAFIGGINLRDAYDNSLGNALFWKDLNIKIEGDAVNSLQLLFFLNWYFVSDEQLPINASFFKKNNIKEVCPIQIAASGPDSDWPSIMQSYFEGINAAQKSVKISTPYFVPNESIVTALRTSALSGISVELIIPINPDSIIAKAVSISYLGQLLEAGVKVYLYKRGMIHSKFMAVDGTFCSIGSANLDIRSFEYNFEVNAIIYNSEITQKLEQEFTNDKADCYEINQEQWENRPIQKKLIQAFMRIVAPLI